MSIFRRYKALIVLLLSYSLLISCKGGATEKFTEFHDVDVCSKGELNKAIKYSRPADRINLCDGVWDDLKLVINNSGTETSPIVIRAKNPGAVTISGYSYIEIYGSYVELSGFRWSNYGEPSIRRGYIQTKPGSLQCKISEMVFERDNLAWAKQWVFNIALQGREHEVFNSSFLGKRGKGAQLVVWEGGDNLQHNLHHLYFQRKPLGFDNGQQVNGGESLQVGLGDGVELGANDIQAHHLYFENASGESEIISLKGSRHRLSDIVMVGCDGSFSLRGGNGHTIERVYIDGRNKSHAVGLRILGDNHFIRDVFVKNISAEWFGGLYFRSGTENYDAADHVKVENVTLMDSQDAIIIGTKKGIAPTNLEFNNLIAVQKKANARVLFSLSQQRAFKFKHSFLYGKMNVPRPSGVKVLNPVMTLVDDGLYIPDPNGPAAGKGSKMTEAPVKKYDVGPQLFSY